MTYNTAITNIENEKEFIRGYSLTDLMQQKTFTEVIFLILKVELPTESETKMLNALFVAAIDHGPGTASAQTARITASAKNSMHTSIAAGILAMGERHGSAIEAAAQFFLEHKDTVDLSALITEKKEAKERIPGFGHAVLTVDHRSEKLFEIATDLGIAGAHTIFAKAVHEELNKQSSKKLPLNIDGAMAAILLDMDFAPGMMKGMFIIGRVPGLVAHITEENTRNEGLRRVPESEINYDGPAPREV